MKQIAFGLGLLLVAGPSFGQSLRLDEVPQPVFLNVEMYLKTNARNACVAALPEEIVVVEGEPDVWAYDPRTLVGAIRVPVTQDGDLLVLWCHVDLETEDFFFYAGEQTPWEDLDRPQEIDPDAFSVLFPFHASGLGDAARSWCNEAVPASEFGVVASTGTRVEFSDPARVTVVYLQGQSEEELQDAFLCWVLPALGQVQFTELGAEFPVDGWQPGRDLLETARPVYVDEGPNSTQ